MRIEPKQKIYRSASNRSQRQVIPSLQKPYSKEALIRELRRFAKKLGRCPTRREIDKNPGLPSGRFIGRQFGSLTNLPKLLGCQPRRRCYTDAELIFLLRKKREELGRVPYISEVIRDKRMPRPVTYADHFGSWAEAVRRAGFAPRRRPDYSFEEIMNRTMEFFHKYKRSPTVKEFEEKIGISHRTLQKWDMTFNQFLTKCGLPIHAGKSMRASLRVNRKGELMVKKELLRLGYKVRDLTAEKGNAPYSFLIDGKIRLHVAASKAHPFGKRSRWVVWTFSIPRNGNFDYVVGVGMDEREKLKELFAFPKRALRGRTGLNIPACGKSQFSRYSAPDLKAIFKR